LTANTVLMHGVTWELGLFWESEQPGAD